MTTFGSPRSFQRTQAQATDSRVVLFSACAARGVLRDRRRSHPDFPDPARLSDAGVSVRGRRGLATSVLCGCGRRGHHLCRSRGNRRDVRAVPPPGSNLGARLGVRRCCWIDGLRGDRGPEGQRGTSQEFLAARSGVIPEHWPRRVPTHRPRASFPATGLGPNWRTTDERGRLNACVSPRPFFSSARRSSARSFSTATAPRTGCPAPLRGLLHQRLRATASENIAPAG